MQNAFRLKTKFNARSVKFIATVCLACIRSSIYDMIKEDSLHIPEQNRSKNERERKDETTQTHLEMMGNDDRYQGKQRWECSLFVLCVLI